MADAAGAVWINVLPSLRGFRQAMGKELGAEARNAGAKAGADFAGGMKEKAAKELAKLSSAVETASKRDAAARKQQTDAAGRLRVAEQKLAEVRANNKAKASQVAAAEESLARAQRNVAATADAAAGSTKKLADTQTKLESATKKLADNSKAGATGQGKLADQTKRVATESKKAKDNVGGLSGQINKMRGGLTNAAKGMAGMAVATTGIVGLGAGFADSISKAGEFDKTIRTVGVNAGLSGAEIDRLRDLSMKMGAETVFSAQGAADAMLELSKGGLSAAQIEAGALSETLTLATAGGLELGDAAGYMVQALTTFNLPADQAGQVAAALAGGANASTASVESMGMALSQVGPSAKLAGLSVQETTAALAAFDNAGIKGSDAGTSLKTMLMNLVPQTEAASGMMADLGLKFTDAQGEFLPLANIAEQLRGSMAKLSPEMQTTALKTMFGADAFRAAAILADQGAAGIDKFTAATSNAKAAQDMAAVGTQGYAGAMEQFKGAVETAQIQLGMALLPALSGVLNFLSGSFMPAIANNIGLFQALGGILATAAAMYGGYVLGMYAHSAAMGVYAFATSGATIATSIMTGAQAALNAVMLLNPVGLVVAGLVALGIAFFVAYKKSETFRNIVQGAWNGIKNAAAAAWQAIKPAVDGFMDGMREIGNVAMQFWRDYLQPAFAGAGAVIMWWWQNIVMRVFAAYKIAFRVAGAVIAFWWNNIVKRYFSLVGAAFRGIAAVISWWYNNIVKRYFAMVGTVFRNVAGVATWLWNDVIKPAFNGIGDIISNVWDLFIRPILGLVMAHIRTTGDVVMWLWNNAVKPAFSALGEFIGWVWNTLIRPTFDALKAAVDVVGSVFTWLWQNAIKPAFDGIGSAISFVWDNVLRPAFDAIKGAVATVADSFETAKNAIGGSWDQIKALAAAPINFVIDTVYNRGIMPVWNTVIEKFGDTSKRLAPIPTFADGGVAAPGWAMVGEQGPELVNFSKPGRVYTASETADALSAMGGPGDWARGAGNWVADRAKDLGEVTLGGLRAAAEHLLKPVRDMVNDIGSGTPYLDAVKGIPNQAIDAMLSWFGAKDSTVPGGMAGGPAVGRDGWAFPLARGSYSVGAGFPYYPSGGYHSGWDFPATTGTPVFSPFAGFFTPGNHGSSAYGLHANVVAGPMRFIGGHLSAITRGAGMVGAGEMIGRVGSSGNSTGPHLHVEFRENGRAINPRHLLTFDSGGKLPPGMNLTYNGTGGPEAILTAQQWDTMRRAAMNGSAAPTVQVFIDGREIESAVVRVANGRDTALTDSLAYGGL